jgi:hypothetical protein
MGNHEIFLTLFIGGLIQGIPEATLLSMLSYRCLKSTSDEREI